MRSAAEGEQKGRRLLVYSKVVTPFITYIVYHSRERYTWVIVIIVSLLVLCVSSYSSNYHTHTQSHSYGYESEGAAMKGGFANEKYVNDAPGSGITGFAAKDFVWRCVPSAHIVLPTMVIPSALEARARFAQVAVTNAAASLVAFPGAAMS